MTGFESKRQATQANMYEAVPVTIDDAQGYIADCEAALKIAYEIGCENGKKAQRKPLTQRQVVEGFCKTPHQVQSVAVFDAGVRFAEAAHGIKEQP